MNAIELFSGIGGFRVAVDNSGIQTVWANDLSPKACIVYRDCFGMSELQEGDFVAFRNQIPKHDLLTGGFPCQPFSSAGKKEGIRDSRGTLFQHIIDTLHDHRPKFFVLENVKRLLTMEKGEHFATILGALADLDYLVEWRLLNAMHFGLPQNRERVFIVGTRIPTGKMSGRPTVKLALKDDLMPLDGRLNDLQHHSDWRAIHRHKKRFKDWGVAYQGAFFTADLVNFSAAENPVKLSSVLEENVPKGFDFTESTLSWLHNNTEVNRFVQGVEILSNQRGGARMGYTIFGVNGVAPTLTSTTSRHYERYRIAGKYRRLTNIEYARIQGFADDHCGAVSIYDQYALYGNAVPPPMAEWVVRQAVGDGMSLDGVRPRVRSLFDSAY